MAGGGGTRLLDKQNPFGVGRRRYRIYGLIIVCIAVFNPVVLSTKHSQVHHFLTNSPEHADISFYTSNSQYITEICSSLMTRWRAFWTQPRMDDSSPSSIHIEAPRNTPEPPTSFSTIRCSTQDHQHQTSMVVSHRSDHHHLHSSQHYKYDNARPNPAHQQIQLSPLSEARVSPPLLSNEVVSPPMSPDIFARPLHSTMLNRRLRKSESSFDEPKKQEINEKMHFGGSAGRVCRGRTGGANSIHAVSKLLKRSVLSDEIMVPSKFANGNVSPRKRRRASESSCSSSSNSEE